MFLKTICSEWKFWSRILNVLFIGGRNWKSVWVFFIFIFNFKCRQAHEEVKNWVGQYDRTSPRTSENWMWPKNLLLRQVYFHELAVLFFWAGRTGLILAPLLTRLWSQFSFVLWDSFWAKRNKPFSLQLSLLNTEVFVIYDYCAPFTDLRKERSVVPFPFFPKLHECSVDLPVLAGCYCHCGVTEVLNRKLSPRMDEDRTVSVRWGVRVIHPWFTGEFQCKTCLCSLERTSVSTVLYKEQIRVGTLHSEQSREGPWGNQRWWYLCGQSPEQGLDCTGPPEPWDPL